MNLSFLLILSLTAIPQNTESKKKRAVFTLPLWWFLELGLPYSPVYSDTVILKFATMTTLSHAIARINAKRLSYLLVLLVALGFVGYYLIQQFGGENRFGRQLLISRGVLLSASALILVWIIKNLPAYFSEGGSARNLAIFRLIFFGFLTLGLPFGYDNLLQHTLNFAELPVSSRVDLPIFQFLVDVIPVNAIAVKLAMVLFACSTVFVFIGFRTKLALIVFSLALLYLFGIPNLYGKINHNHHILWFSVILIFSSCSDVLSVDAWLARRKNSPIQPKSKTVYGFPFRVMWLLMGLIYFFPGFWKVWTSGLDWALTDNVQNHMYWKWHELGDWLPYFRLDRYPLFYKFSGVYTILFELSFITLLFTKRTRALAAVLGLLFHLGTWAFMNIFFVVLVISYVSFINWERIFPDRTNQSEDRKGIAIPKPLKWIGAILIIGNVIFGVAKINSWPFTVYPVFDGLVNAHTKTLSFSYSGELGERLFVDKELLKNHFSSERYRNMEHQIIGAYEQGNLPDRVSLIESILETIDLPHDQKIEVSIEHVSVTPETCGQVESTELIYESGK